MSGSPSLHVSSKRTVTNTVIPADEITLSKDKLQSVLREVYEDAHSTVCQFHWYDLCAVSFSIAFTLLITLLTTEFRNFSNDVEWMTSGRLTIIAWIVFLGSLIFGCIGLVVRSSPKSNTVFSKRDAVVLDAIEKLCKND